MDRRTFLQGAALIAAANVLPIRAQGLETVAVQVDLANAVGPLAHVWEECAGSDRAAITLRDDWRQDLVRWRTEAGLKRVRFHGIFNDELGVDAPSILSHGTAQVNFQNIDRVYDGLLARGVSPYVELSFMPKKLASADRKFGFYGGNISPPASLEDWAVFVKSFLSHLIDRYGLAAVKSWPFEVWNEPNLGFFWSGTQQQYFEFYRATALAIKSLDDSLKVGGPSTARAEWVGEFAAYAGDNNVPIDFFSTHTYAGDSLKQMFGDEHFAAADVIPEAMRRVRNQIDASPLRGRPLWLSEWSSDSPAMILHVISGCIASVTAMSQWALSATFEELGVANYLLKEGYGGWGMMVQGIALPSFNTYKLLHLLGNERLEAKGPALASRRADRSVAALVWNLADVAQPSGIPDAGHSRSVSGTMKRFQVELLGARRGQRVNVRFVDQDRGSPMPAWREMGSPQYPRPDQIELLRHRADIAPPLAFKVNDARKIEFDLPPEGVAMLEL